MKLSFLSVLGLSLWAPLAAQAASQDASTTTTTTSTGTGTGTLPAAIQDGDGHDAHANDNDSGAHPGRWRSLLGSRSDLEVGVAASYGQRYPGADVGRLQVLPVISFQRGIVFADTARGAGLQFAAGGLYLSQSMFYDLGRLDRNSSWRPGSSRLAGMGDVPGSITTRTLAVEQFTPWLAINAEAEFALRDGARRNQFRAGVEFSLLKNTSDGIVLDADTLWGDRRYNQAYFGVTAAQAARTRLEPFRADGGLYAWSIGMTWEHHLDAHWTTTLEVAGTHYGVKVASSPIIARRTEPGATAAITYTY